MFIFIIPVKEHKLQSSSLHTIFHPVALSLVYLSQGISKFSRISSFSIFPSGNQTLIHAHIMQLVKLCFTILVQEIGFEMREASQK